MSRTPNPQFPTKPFGLLLVEGGDELRLCEAVAGPTTWAGLVAWKAQGREDLPSLARLATMAPSFSHARSVGVLFDMEDDTSKAQSLAQQVLQILGAAPGTPTVHGALAGQPRKLGVFIAPDGQQIGSIEKLCMQAVRSPQLAQCVNTFVACSGAPQPTQALRDKGWLSAYLSMLPSPLRFYQALTEPQGIDPAHPVFDPLRAFLQSL
ncbi:hypothetical protein MYSTI_08026 [Myxococcus stipitatus DSM 14675]|uniref:Uncharacterized protein n=1 Tax=Myxococcus stipitatus (strain DSM 14675 / JCM 12634 / Mx s8) TaxID=1278073 RepID=L7UNZ7_MYXSD|nr:DUF3226 domain-containing protein [Myxococcus stipitatus]AGC49292.1 hypothetical protein MYSTI_08026 [Myxococcus stipitatus DSM 14675]